jgi:S-adenosyl methyltransferase
MKQFGDFADIDTKTPSGARAYDYMLGGTDNYAIDRMAANSVTSSLSRTDGSRFFHA